MTLSDYCKELVFRGVGQVVDRYIWDVDVASSSLVTPTQPYLADIHTDYPPFVILGGYLLSPIFIYLQRSLRLSGVDSVVTVSHNVDRDVVLEGKTSTHLCLHLWVL